MEISTQVEVFEDTVHPQNLIRFQLVSHLVKERDLLPLDANG
jgi:hypothetical protein